MRSLAPRLLVLLALAAGAALAAPEILGARPSYAPGSLSAMPNEAAVGPRIWVPELDAGFDPQGLAVAEGELLVSGFRSDSFGVNRGPCRVVRIDPGSGAVTGAFDVPPPCGHAGGLAYAGQGLLYISDTRHLFETRLDRAFGPGPPAFRVFPLAPGVFGGLAAAGDGEIWLGRYAESGPADIIGIRLERLLTLGDGEPVTRDLASQDVPLPTYAQGATIDASGKLWVARSEIGWGSLEIVEIASGAVEGRYPIAGGTEGLAFGRDGRLWAVSEAGAHRFYQNPAFSLFVPFYPLVYAIDVRRLKGG